MTRQSTFKRKVRARMTKTGESYTAARSAADRGTARRRTHPPAFEPRLSDETVRTATGRGWEEWFELLDRGVRDDRRVTRRSRSAVLARRHRRGWWAQSVTVSLRAGARDCGRRPAARRLRDDRVEDGRGRRSRRPYAGVRRRRRARALAARRGAAAAHGDGAGRPAMTGRTARPASSPGSRPRARPKSQVAIAHQQLPDADAAEAMKAYWRERRASRSRRSSRAELLRPGAHPARLRHTRVVDACGDPSSQSACALTAENCCLGTSGLESEARMCPRGPSVGSGTSRHADREAGGATARAR